jgi:hypothetical protein
MSTLAYLLFQRDATPAYRINLGRLCHMAKNPDLSKAPVPTRMRDLREKLGYNRKGDFAPAVGSHPGALVKRRARLSTQPGYVRPAEKGHSRPDP